MQSCAALHTVTLHTHVGAVSKPHILPQKCTLHSVVCTCVQAPLLPRMHTQLINVQSIVNTTYIC
jgi:hypothetical protein